MSYQETQTSISAWMVATFPGMDPESPRKSLRALEEMVELCLACGASYGDVEKAARKGIGDSIGKIPGGIHQGMSSNYNAARKPESPAKIAAEAADVLIVLFGVAHMRGFDLMDEVDKKMAINRARRFASRNSKRIRSAKSVP